MLRKPAFCCSEGAATENTGRPHRSLRPTSAGGQGEHAHGAGTTGPTVMFHWALLPQQTCPYLLAPTQLTIPAEDVRGPGGTSEARVIFLHEPPVCALTEASLQGSCLCQQMLACEVAAFIPVTSPAWS